MAQSKSLLVGISIDQLGEPSKKMGKVGILSQPGGGVWPNPNFLAKFPKTKFALQLAINVMKHTLQND